MTAQTNDFLDEMTKEEIVRWIRSRFFYKNLPKKSDILFQRWEIQSQRILDEIDAENKRFAQVDFSKRDEYAKQFNASKCNDERLKILLKIKPFDDEIQRHFKQSKLLDAKRIKIDKIYEQAEKLRLNEVKQ
jgi:hypothetical protein